MIEYTTIFLKDMGIKNYQEQDLNFDRGAREEWTDWRTEEPKEENLRGRPKQDGPNGF